MAEQTVPATTDRTERTPATRDDERFSTPPVDIYETDDELVVVADLPGVDKSALDVRVEDGRLTIQGRAAHEMPGLPVREEFELGTFFRQFELAEIVDQTAIKAELRNGVLTLHLPKADEVKPRSISVEVA